MDRETQECIQRLKDEMAKNITQIYYEMGLIKPEPPPTLFNDMCLTCKKTTKHRSFYKVSPQGPMWASTTMITLVNPVLKVCLSCGLETRVKHDQSSGGQ